MPQNAFRLTIVCSFVRYLFETAFESTSNARAGFVAAQLRGLHRHSGDERLVFETFEPAPRITVRMDP